MPPGRPTTQGQRECGGSGGAEQQGPTPGGGAEQQGPTPGGGAERAWATPSVIILVINHHHLIPRAAVIAVIFW